MELAEAAGFDTSCRDTRCRLNTFAELIVLDALHLFSRPAEQCTQSECMADDYATATIEKHFGFK